MAGVVAADELPASGGDEQASPYARWVETEGLDVIDGSFLADLRAVELNPWARRGGRGVFVHRAGAPVASDCYLCEIPPGRSLAPQRQRFEELVLILDGRGSSSVAGTDGKAFSFEWKAGTAFAVARDVEYRHFNGSGRQCARFIAVTTAPAIIQACGDPEFAYGAARDAGMAASERASSCASALGDDLDAAPVLDVLECPLGLVPECGVGGHFSSRLGTGGLSVLVSQLPPATYGMAHAYGADAVVVVLAGEGYSLIWPEGGERTRRRWREGALLTAPSASWRQHFNPAGSPARYVVLATEAALLRNARGVPSAWISRRLGGARIDYADEAAGIRACFADALAACGAESRMGEVYAAETP